MAGGLTGGGLRERWVVTLLGGPSTSPVAVMSKRAAFALLLSLASTAAVADSLLCGDSKPQHYDLFSPDEMKAILDGKPHGDPVLEEAAALEAQNRVAPVSPTSSSKLLTWFQARKMILSGAVSEIHQSHNQRVVLLRPLRSVRSGCQAALPARDQAGALTPERKGRFNSGPKRAHDADYGSESDERVI